MRRVKEFVGFVKKVNFIRQSSLSHNRFTAKKPGLVHFEELNTAFLADSTAWKRKKVRG
jgi:hypothetical protein